MTDLLGEAVAWLAGQREDFLSQTVAYSRAGDSVELPALVGATTYEQMDDAWVPRLAYNTGRPQSKLWIDANNDGKVRIGELREACGILGVSDIELLGYRDSGMMGTADNQHPDCFWQAGFMEAVGRLVRVIRKHRPEVVTLIDEPLSKDSLRAESLTARQAALTSSHKWS